ncbi:hypothetical protein APHNP_1593 [Anaplasma phagocytophilum str. ApNP]|uniref:Uncharacterized protein n=1 Tax=Anaplasma phagocytophilum str. ApNP TaxID=1359153 RepID=A0A0F3NEC9_ANAPH|nr:hypothetical protein APHNP_1593 [Anaplasma phagocytophilum str. ApNP]
MPPSISRAAPSETLHVAFSMIKILKTLQIYYGRFGKFHRNFPITELIE